MSKSIPFLLISLVLSLLTTPRVEAQTTILFEGFEDPDAFATNWVVGSVWEGEEDSIWGVVDRQFGSVNTRTGNNKLYCSAFKVNGLPGWTGKASAPRYPDEMWTYISRDIDLQDYKAATLTLWYHNKVFPGNDDEMPEFFSDMMTIYIDDEPVYSTDWDDEQTKSWVRITINLEDYVGTVCNLRIEFESDFYGQEDGVAAGEGIYIDDVLITGYKSYRPDLNKDGMTDLLFHNLQTGTLAVWHMANYTKVKTNLLVRDGIPVPLYWRVVGISDFDNDGNADILWHHADGRLTVWYMDGGEFLGNSMIRKVGPNWKLTTLADFNNDGSQDFIWQHADRRLAVWYMDGTNFLSSALLDRTLPNGNLHVVSSGDFNFDGHRDLLLQNTYNGRIIARELQGLKYIKDTRFTAEPGITFAPEWRVAGTHDMDGDGEPDLLMRHKDGRLEAWILYGTHVVQRKEIRQVNTKWTNAGNR